MYVVDSEYMTPLKSMRHMHVMISSSPPVGQTGATVFLGIQSILLTLTVSTSWLTAEQELFNTQISQVLSVAQHVFERLTSGWRSARANTALRSVSRTWQAWQAVCFIIFV